MRPSAGLVAVGALLCGLAAPSVGHAVGATPAVPARLVAAPHGLPKLSAPKVLHVPDAWEMQGVSCVSASRCVAVGYGAGLGPKPVDGGVLVPVNDGRLGKPLISADTTSAFFGVSCVTATRCVVVGEGTPTSKSAEVAEAWLWNGHKLAFISQSTATTETSSRFAAVDCWSATKCIAVGDALHNTKIANGQPIAVFGGISLKVHPIDDVVLNSTAGYAASVACPTAQICYAGGSTAAGGGEEVRIYRGSDIKGVDQSSIAGLEGIACQSADSCEASGDSDLTFGQFQGWLDHVGGFKAGTAHKLVGTEQMFAIAAINRSYYLSVGYGNGAAWVTDLVSAAGTASPLGNLGDGGYLQGVTCPVQTECVAVGFTIDANPHQPGGRGGVDGAIAIFHLKTPPGAPKVEIRSSTRTSVTVHLTAPGSNGGAAIASYRLTISRCKPHHAGCQLESVKAVHVRPSKLTVSVTGLKPHTTYYFAASATNAIGTGPASSRKHTATRH